MINLIRDYGTTNSGAGSYTQSQTGAVTASPLLGDISSYASNVYDGDWENPFYGDLSSFGSQSGIHYVNLQTTHTFPRAYDIDLLTFKLEIKTQANASGDNPRYFKHLVDVKYLQNGLWVDLLYYYQYVTGGRYGGGTHGNWYGGDWRTYEPGVLDYTNIKNVSALSFKVCGECQGAGGEGWITRYCQVRLYEIEAWGKKYLDSGIRVKTNSGAQEIGCEPLTPSHKLRIAKNNVTYGIPLLNTADPNVSSVRVVDVDGTVKSIPQNK